MAIEKINHSEEILEKLRREGKTELLNKKEDFENMLKQYEFMREEFKENQL